MYAPEILPNGTVVTDAVANVDIWPTIFDLLGVDSDPEGDGHSMLPLIEATWKGEEASPSGERVIFSQLDQTWGRRGRDPMPQIAIAKGRHRLVVTEIEKGGKGQEGKKERREELFDRTSDRFETRDLSQSDPGAATRLREYLTRYVETGPPWSEQTPSLEMDEMELNQLRALGYAIP